MSISDNDSLCNFNIYDNDLFFNDDNINFSNGLAEVVFNNYELGNFNNDRRAGPPYPQIDDLNFIFSSEPKQGEINDREITYSLWKYRNEINDNVKIEIKNDYWNDRYHNKYREKINKRKKEIITCECGATLKRGNLWNHRKLSKTHRKNMIKINSDKYILDKK